MLPIKKYRQNLHATWGFAHTQNAKGEDSLQTFKKFFLRDFEAIMKIHVPLQLENKMKNLLDQMKLILALSKWQKNVLKMTTQKSKTLPFTKIFLTHASLCCDVMMARHIGQPRWRVYDSLLIKRMLKELLKVDVQHLDYWAYFPLLFWR